MPNTPTSFAELFTPKLVTVLREGYGANDLRRDILSGLTVAIVALPLSMAIAIASGTTPDRGLYTAIIGGFFVSLLGGSRYQIGGPAGAFIVLVATTVQVHGIEGLILATLLSGLILLAVGFLQLGTFIKYVPYPVTVGFTSGIAVVILASQIKDLFGLKLAGAEPAELVPKLRVLAEAIPSISPTATVLSAAAVVVIVGLRRWKPQLPGLLIVVAGLSVVVWALKLPVETIGTRFGGIPNGLPAPHLPVWSIEKIFAVLPAAFSFALLGSIESLLSAVVADSMSGARHRSNCELVAQGVANVASALFGGFCVTGTIARTATNIRSGARGPIAGMLHSLFLLLFMMLAAPLASYIPLAALAGVLTVVAWGMVEKHAFATLVRASRGDAVVVLATFLITIFRDLTEGIVAGFSLSALLFLHRMAQSINVQNMQPSIDQDQPDSIEEADGRGRPAAVDFDIMVSRISGAFFFGAAAGVARALDRIGARPRAYVLDVSDVLVLDSTAAATLDAFVRKVTGQGALVYFAGAAPMIAQTLMQHELQPPRAIFAPDVASAIAAVRVRLGQGRSADGTVIGNTVPLVH